MNSADNNQNTQPHNQTDATSNVLGEAISESEPTSEPKIIDSQVDLTTYQIALPSLKVKSKKPKKPRPVPTLKPTMRVTAWSKKPKKPKNLP